MENFYRHQINIFIIQGCGKCNGKFRKSNEEFKLKGKEIHGNLFDYSKSEYVNKGTKVIIKCNECGKEFKMTPHNHLIHKEGCPYCRLSKLEKNVETFLIKNNIEFEQQKVFDWFIDGKSIKRLDFYLPEYNTAIECQGLQHFKPIEWFGGIEAFSSLVERDELKKNLCEEHNIKIIYYSNLDIKYPYKVITQEAELIKEIKGC